MSKVLIGGGTGLIGMRLSQVLKQKGYEVIHLSRKRDLTATFPRYAWDVTTGEFDEEAFHGVDYVINLAGAGIADKRWTASRKQLIIESRVKSMQLFHEAFKITGKLPKAFIAASATGLYGNRDEEWLTENSAPGTGFLSESTQAWEKSITEMKSLNTRLVTIRIGIVLSLKGGAFPQLRMPQKFGIGAYFSNGRQYYPWIHIDDICAIFVKSIEDDRMKGIFNGVAPNPATNIEVTKAIAKAKNRKVLMMPVPSFLLRIGLGEMADVILTSARVSSQKLLDQGFEFKFPNLTTALEALLSRDV